MGLVRIILDSRILLLGGFYCLLVVACSKHSLQHVELPEAVTELNVDSIESNLILNPVGIVATDNYLIIANSKRDTLFDVFDNKTGNYLYSDLVMGQGPEDVSAFRNIVHWRGDRIYVNGLGIPSITMIDVAKERLRVAEKRICPLKDNIYQAIYALNDEDALAQPTGGEYEWMYYNGKTKAVNGCTSFSLSDITGGSVTEFGKISNSMGSVAVSPDMSHFMFFYSWFPYMKIFNSSGDVLFEKSVEVPLEQITYESDILKRRPYYHICVKTNDYVFISYTPLNSENESSCFIQVWNWSGELLKVLKLPDGIDVFTVTPNAKRIYGVKADSDKIYYCDLSL